MAIPLGDGQWGNPLTHDTLTAAETLEITVKHGEQAAVFYLHGRLSIDSSPGLRDRLLAMLREQSSKAVIVDLAAVSYIDASGIATLLEGLKLARNRQTKLCLQGLQDRVVHLFEVTGVLALFEANGCKSAFSGAKVS
jgi:anti-sigma B factor antagonist